MAGRRRSTRSIPNRRSSKLRRPGIADGQLAHRAQDRRRVSLALQVSASTAKAASRSASCFRTWPSTIDDIAVIRSMDADMPNHEPSLLLMNCGEARLPRPSMGTWLTYGLGSENQNLPGFIAMCPGGFPIQASQNWQSAFPAGHSSGHVHRHAAHRGRQADRAHSQRDRPAPSSGGSSTCCRALNQEHRQQARRRPAARSPHPVVRAGLSHADARRPRRSTSAASRSTSSTCTARASQARQILIARRLVERGVRFVQVWHGAGQPWDIHDDIEATTASWPRECDQAIGALLDGSEAARPARRDAGDLGRRVRPHADRRAGQSADRRRKINGRDHNHYGFTMWLAGGGVTGGIRPRRHRRVRLQRRRKPGPRPRPARHDPAPAGLRPRAAHFRYAGRDFRLTDVHGRVVHELIA